MKKKRLYRNKKQGLIAGVCAGIADYFDADPVLVRLIWIIITLAWGAGLLAYLIAWVIIPLKK